MQGSVKKKLIYFIIMGVLFYFLLSLFLTSVVSIVYCIFFMLVILFFLNEYPTKTLFNTTENHDFDKFIVDVISPQIDIMAKTKKKYLILMLTYFPTAIISIYFAIPKMIKGWAVDNRDFLSLFISIAIAIIVYSFLDANFQKRFSIIVEKIVFFVDINLKYHFNNGVAKSVFNESRLFSIFPDKYFSRNHICGKHDYSDFEFSTVNAQQKITARKGERDETSYESFFCGIFFITSLKERTVNATTLSCLEKSLQRLSLGTLVSSNNYTLYVAVPSGDIFAPPKSFQDTKEYHRILEKIRTFANLSQEIHREIQQHCLKANSSKTLTNETNSETDKKANFLKVNSSEIVTSKSHDEIQKEPSQKLLKFLSFLGVDFSEVVKNVSNDKEIHDDKLKITKYRGKIKIRVKNRSEVGCLAIIGAILISSIAINVTNVFVSIFLFSWLTVVVAFALYFTLSTSRVIIDKSRVSVKKSIFGLGFNKSIKIEDVNNVDLTDSYTVDDNCVYSICISSDQKNLRFGSSLEDRTKQQLVTYLTELLIEN